MKIIHFVANLSNLRGMENQAILQYNFLKKLYDVNLWTLSLPDNDENYNLIVYKFLKSKIYFSFFYVFINSIFLNEKTIFHIHGLSVYVFPFLITKLFNKNIKVILKISNSGEKSSFQKIKNKFPILGKLMIKIIIFSIDKWICINSQIKDESLKEGIRKEKLLSNTNGVE